MARPESTLYMCWSTISSELARPKAQSRNFWYDGFSGISWIYCQSSSWFSNSASAAYFALAESLLPSSEKIGSPKRLLGSLPERSLILPFIILRRSLMSEVDEDRSSRTGNVSKSIWLFYTLRSLKGACKGGYITSRL